MKFSKKTKALRLALFICSVIAVMPFSAYANNRDLNNRLERIERDIETMNRAVFRGSNQGRFIANQESGAAPSSLAAFEERISGIENDKREAINKLEELNHNLNLLKNDFERMRTDVEQRLQELESGKARGNAVAPLKNREANVQSSNVPTPVAKSSDDNMQSELQAQPVVYESGAPEKLYNKAFSEIKGGKYDAAEKSFNEFITKYSSHQLSPNAFYWLGEAYYVRGDYQNAARTFARCFQRYPDSSKSLDSLLKLGLSLSTMGNDKDACLSYAQLIQVSTNTNSPVHKRAVAEFEKLKCE